MTDRQFLTKNLTEVFMQTYAEKIFYYCLKRTGNAPEAEDLSQDIFLNVLTSLQNGAKPVHFSAWVWQIARNRYCVWAENKHRHTESVTGSDIGDYEIEDESKTPEEKLIGSEQLALLRRELAFIRGDYRNIIVAYYIEDRGVREIAASLSLTEDTVKQRLHRARKSLKEGMNMAREFGTLSYKPENIAFIMNGMSSSAGEPWNYLSRLLCKNKMTNIRFSMPIQILRHSGERYWKRRSAADICTIAGTIPKECSAPISLCKAPSGIRRFYLVRLQRFLICPCNVS